MGKAAQFARKVVLGINVGYLALGIIVISAGSSFQKSGGMADKTTLLQEGFSLGDISGTILFTGWSTVVMAAMGLLASYKQWRKLTVVYCAVLLILSFMLMGAGSTLNNKDAEMLRIPWEDTTLKGNNNRAQFMENFQCCGFDRNTDSYQLTECHIDLNANPATWACKAAAAAWLETDIHPNARSAIWMGVIEFLSIVVSGVIIFTDKGMKTEVLSSWRDY